MIKPLTARVLISNELQHFNAELKLLSEYVLQIVWNLIDDDEGCKRSFEDQPLKQVIQVAEVVRGSVRFALSSRPRRVP